ncbi:MAG: MotA/TolQ/ExbB proton channel family protein [Candidatus Latescibacteria bacterium]|jgi:biopolymer transport protein ExbB|nr:MotA/TolQ/ExbB proton channel family protein [Candidatus Latescibacterota bacterium]
MLDLFYDGGPFMYPLLLTLIFGMGVILERFWALSRASINTRKFLQGIKIALREEGITTAQEICASTRGPVASIFHAGLMRVDRGLEHVEKAIENAGTIEMSFLEKGLVWLATVANIAPMLGFLGTVSGMIGAFASIAAAGDVNATIVASGISEALITTATGLAIAIPVQAAHNYFVSRIDRLIIDMEESANDLIDYLIEMEMEKTA